MIKKKENEFKVQPNGTNHFVVPASSISAGKSAFLAIIGGVSNVELDSHSNSENLFEASFQGPLPTVRSRNLNVTVEYSRLFHPFDWRSYGADINLSTLCPWYIEFLGGLSNLKSDLSSIQLKQLIIKGGISKSKIALPDPSGLVSIEIDGGASDLDFYLSGNTSIKVKVKGGAKNIVLKDQAFGSIGKNLAWSSPDFEQSPHGYIIEILGGVSHMTIF